MEKLKLSFDRLRYRFGSVLLTVGIKLRQGIRALYASTTKQAAREIVHKLEEVSKSERQLRRENTRLLTLLQSNKSDIEPSKIDRSVEAEFEINRLKGANAKQKHLIDQLMSERKVLTDGLAEETGPIKSFSLRLENRRLKRKLRKSLSDSSDQNNLRLAFLDAYGAAPVFQALDYALYANSSQMTLTQNFTHVIAHDILCISAAATLAAKHKAELWVDLVEEPRLENRTGDHYRTNMLSRDLDILNALHERVMQTADKIITIGPYQHDNIKQTHTRNVFMLPNYRDKFISSRELHEKATALLNEVGVSENFILIPNHIRSEDEISPILEALSGTALELDIVHLGPSLSDGIKSKIDKLSKKHLIHFFALGMQPYDIYRQILSMAQGVVIINIGESKNAVYAYPNRLFDSASALCPIITFGFKQVERFVLENDVGVVLSDLSDKSAIASAIKGVQKNRARYQNNLNVALQKYNWSAFAQSAFKDIQSGSSVAIISKKDLRANIRVKLISETLRSKDCDVCVIGSSKDSLHSLGHHLTVPLSKVLTSKDIV